VTPTAGTVATDGGATNRTAIAATIAAREAPTHEFDLILDLAFSNLTQLNRSVGMQQARSLRQQQASTPLGAFVASLRERFDALCMFFYDQTGGPRVALKWRPGAFCAIPGEAGVVHHHMLLKRTNESHQFSPAQGSLFALPDVAVALVTMRTVGNGSIRRIQVAQQQQSIRLRLALGEQSSIVLPSAAPIQAGF